MQGEWHVCRVKSASHNVAIAKKYLVRHMQISEDDVKSISAATSMQLIHHSGHLAVACPLQDA